MQNNKLIEELERLRNAATPGPYSLKDWRKDDGPDPWMLQGQEPEKLFPGRSYIWPNGMRSIKIADFEEGDDREVMAPLCLALLSNLDTILAALKAAQAPAPEGDE